MTQLSDKITYRSSKTDNRRERDYHVDASLAIRLPEDLQWVFGNSSSYNGPSTPWEALQRFGELTLGASSVSGGGGSRGWSLHCQYTFRADKPSKLPDDKKIIELIANKMGGTTASDIVAHIEANLPSLKVACEEAKVREEEARKAARLASRAKGLAEKVRRAACRAAATQVNYSARRNALDAARDAMIRLIELDYAQTFAERAKEVHSSYDGDLDEIVQMAEEVYRKQLAEAAE